MRITDNCYEDNQSGGFVRQVRRIGVFLLLLTLPGVPGSGLLALGQTPAPGTSPPEASRPTWIAGDTWTYTRTTKSGALTYQLTVVGEGTFEGKPGYQIRSANYHYWFTKDIGFMARLQEDKVVRRVKPPTDWVWPLALGRGWERKVQWEDTERGLRRYSYTDSWKVDAYEEVKVSSGTFKTFKLVRKTERPGAYDEIWYSPEVKRWVKARGSSYTSGDYEEELVSYKVR